MSSGKGHRPVSTLRETCMDAEPASPTQASTAVMATTIVATAPTASFRVEEKDRLTL
jgi:hypothetical protein